MLHPFPSHPLALGVLILSSLVAGCGPSSTVDAPPVLASPGPVSSANSIQIELVNDTGNTGGDDKMFVLFDTPKIPASGAASGITLVGNSGDATTNAEGFALSSLTTSSNVVSPYTGRTRPVYAFSLSNVDSGRLSFSYGKAIKIANGKAPTAETNVRYDKMEITFKPDATTGVYGGGGNLTAIDFHAIPLQVEVTHAGDTQPDPLQTKSFYASMPTMLKLLTDAGKDRNIDMAGALRSTDGTNWPYTAGTTDFSTFARIQSPNTLAAATGSNGSPAPYPSFKTYLNSLVGKSYVVNGTQYGGSKFTASFSSDGASGFVITCVGSANTKQENTQPPPVPPLPEPQPGVTTTVTIKLPKDQLDFFIYATVANSSSYSIAEYPFKDDTGSPRRYVAQDMVKQANASIYGALVGDLQAALNFGYLGGRFDASTFTPAKSQDISTYYAAVLLPYAYPFGGARYTNDGFYNPYAALFNYLSDAYGHPYSDRLAAASPLYTLKAGDTVRITILNDNRLDTPLASVSSPTDSTLTVSWPTVAGATAYTVKTSPPIATPPCAGGIVAKDNQQKCVLSGLRSGTSYLVSVTAQGANDKGAAIASATLPLQGMTTGTATKVPSGTFAFEIAVNLPNAPVIPGMRAYIEDQLANGGPQARLQGSAGTNTYSLQIKDADSKVVYASNYFLVLSQSGDTAAKTFAVDSATLDYGLTPLTLAGNKPYRNGGGLVVGTPFGPKPYYQYFPVVFP